VPEVRVTKEGTVQVPSGSGLGFEVDLDYINSQTDTVERMDTTRT
jgi:hypothetical protein